MGGTTARGNLDEAGRAAQLDLLAAIRAALAGRADPRRAAHQQAYMKSSMPYYGVGLPALRRAVRPILAAPGFELASAGQWRAMLTFLWDQAAFREEWYAALTLARHPAYSAYAQQPDALPVYHHLIQTGAWWDVVDDIAQHLLGPALRAHPEVVGPQLRRWATDPSRWVRRSAILAQLDSGPATDTDLLGYALSVNLRGSAYGSEFFIAKAIGWALRQYANAEPGAAAWVHGYVAAHADDLAPLSVREATKHLR